MSPYVVTATKKRSPLNNNYIDIILPLGISGTYTYSVPRNIQCPQRGMRVLAPLGNKTVIGIVYRIYSTLPIGVQEDKVRSIFSVPDSLPIVTEKQLALWEWVSEYYMSPIGNVMDAALPAKATDKIYELDKTKRRVKIPVYTDEIEPIHPLTDQQARAKQEIEALWQTKDVVLLHGVTSSGKTEVYMHLIEEQLQTGKQVLYLVPEIALTTQLTDRLQKVFGEQLWVYHSRVTDAQRMEIYRQLVTDRNTPRLVIGARSAVFLPLQNPGLIIVDEEHEPSYKQVDPAPRYHARSTAIMIAHQNGAKVLLGTATPSIESYYNALHGKYGLVEMKERYAGLQLPRITLIDLQRQYHRKEMYGHFSDPLVDRIREELSKGKQIILFQNRRGYAPLLVCEQCCHIPKCPNCDVPMSLHLHAGQIRCHYCGEAQPIPTTCPDCKGKLKIQGFGTERIEDELYKYFPQARIARMDLDSTRNKDDYQSIISSFSRHEVDILIGTQMVTKGLHFNDVSLVAVLSADHLFNIPEYYSYERAYQMLEQVSGRAGREGQQGEVIIQTWDPKHPVFNYLKGHDYEAFYSEQIGERATYHFPPFHRIISITIRHTNAGLTQAAAELLQQQLKIVFGSRCSELVIPGIVRIQRFYLRQIKLKIEATSNLKKAKQLLQQQIDKLLQQKGLRSVQILTDVDPL